MTRPTVSARFVRAGDSTIVVEFEERIDPEINTRCIAVAERMWASGVAGIRDVVPTYRSVAVYFNPLKTDHTRLVEILKRATFEPVSAPNDPARFHRIPVCYGGDFGPDLLAVADFARLTVDDTIARHARPRYRVFMLGFVPGFAYMGSVDGQIAAPRRATPRTKVPAGSVGIAGVQTGIYPTETPGGWQLIGRTPLRPFDSRRPHPSLFQPGDAVQFFPIGPAEWDRYTS
jgi:inhibitor of KinA